MSRICHFHYGSLHLRNKPRLTVHPQPERGYHPRRTGSVTLCSVNATISYKKARGLGAASSSQQRSYSHGHRYGRGLRAERGSPGQGRTPPPGRPSARADPRRSALRSGPGGAPRQVGARRPGRDLLQTHAADFFSSRLPASSGAGPRRDILSARSLAPKNMVAQGLAAPLGARPGESAALARRYERRIPADRGRPRGPTSFGEGRAVPGAGQGQGRAGPPLPS